MGSEVPQNSERCLAFHPPRENRSANVLTWPRCKRKKLAEDMFCWQHVKQHQRLMTGYTEKSIDALVEESREAETP